MSGVGDQRIRQSDATRMNSAASVIAIPAGGAHGNVA